MKGFTKWSQVTLPKTVGVARGDQWCELPPRSPFGDKSLKLSVKIHLPEKVVASYHENLHYFWKTTFSDTPNAGKL
jgi:hypothetical protein